MTLQKVTWEYINGIPAMLNLINMIEVAIQGASIDFYNSTFKDGILQRQKMPELAGVRS